MKLNPKNFFAIISFLIFAYFVLASFGPETYVLSGHEIPQKYMKTMKNLSLIEPGDNLQFFYSDAFLDIKDGFFFVTDKKLVMYSKAWDVQKIVIPFEDIIDLTPEFEDSSWDDSSIWLRTIKGDERRLLVSSDYGGDKRVYEYLKNNSPKVTGSNKNVAEAGKQ